MSNTSYNGWTNYPTWRVHLEMFDGMEFPELEGVSRYEAGQSLKEYAEAFIEDTTSEGLGRDWALAFIATVDWYEIADHVMYETTESDED